MVISSKLRLKDIRDTEPSEFALSKSAKTNGQRAFGKNKGRFARFNIRKTKMVL